MTREQLLDALKRTDTRIGWYTRAKARAEEELAALGDTRDLLVADLADLEDE